MTNQKTPYAFSSKVLVCACVLLSTTAFAQPEQPEPPPWYANFKLAGFVDAYAALRSDHNSRPTFAGVPTHGYYHEAYVPANGFALAFAGLDAQVMLGAVVTSL